MASILVSEEFFTLWTSNIIDYRHFYRAEDCRRAGANLSGGKMAHHERLGLDGERMCSRQASSYFSYRYICSRRRWGNSVTMRRSLTARTESECNAAGEIFAHTNISSQKGEIARDSADRREVFRLFYISYLVEWILIFHEFMSPLLINGGQAWCLDASVG